MKRMLFALILPMLACLSLAFLSSSCTKSVSEVVGSCWTYEETMKDGSIGRSSLYFSSAHITEIRQIYNKGTLIKTSSKEGDYIYDNQQITALWPSDQMETFGRTNNGNKKSKLSSQRPNFEGVVMELTWTIQ